MNTRPHVKVFGFEVRFEAFFWITAIFIGYRFGEERIGEAALWIFLLTASVLIHELGHACAYRHYGAKARIAMTGFGGLTYGTDAEHLTPKQKIVVSLAGSTVELALLGLPAWILQKTWAPEPWSWAGLTLEWLVWINVVWALINLLPVWPMDGGKVVEQLFVLRSGRPRKRLVHKISIAAGTLSAAAWWLVGIPFAAYMFVFFVILNLFAIQVFKTKKPVQLWPGMNTAEGTSREWKYESTAKPMTVQDHLRSGYAALLDERTHDADAHLASFIDASKRANKVEHRLADELEVWRHFTAGRTDLAESTFDETTKTSASLQAVVALHRGNGDIADLAKAVQREAEHPASQQGIVWAARNGYIEALVQAVLFEGTSESLGHAVRIESILDKAELEDARRRVELLI